MNVVLITLVIVTIVSLYVFDVEKIGSKPMLLLVTCHPACHTTLTKHLFHKGQIIRYRR